MISFRRVVRMTYRAIPTSVRNAIDPEESSIERFVRFAAAKVMPGERILDAGAGTQPYQRLFGHARYESTDLPDPSSASTAGGHTFDCTLECIPCESSTYDAILCTQVLEHVEYPQRVIAEFFRILKPGGKLFLTAPQGWGLHGEPHHYFNFAEFGLRSLFRNAGFSIECLTPRGGIFLYLADRMRTLPWYILSQYIGKPGARGTSDTVTAAVLLPAFIVAAPLCFILAPVLCQYLDRLDKKKGYTLGYACYCTRPPDGEQ